MLCQAGSDALQTFAREMAQAVEPIYPTGKPFAETLALSRKRLGEARNGAGSDLAFAIQAKLRAGFPAECRDFASWTGVQPLEYLTA